ncbi:unnamed protein product, partial [marine sediment metagenome]
MLGSYVYGGFQVGEVPISGNTITDIDNPDGASVDHTCGINVWDGAENVVIYDNTISDIKFNGIILQWASDVCIDENSITDCESGIKIEPDSGPVSGTLVTNNEILYNEHGIYLYGDVAGTEIGSKLDGEDANTITGSTAYDIYALDATGPVDIWEDNVYDTMLLENSDLIYVHVTPGEPAEALVTGDGSVDAPDADATIDYTGAEAETITIQDIEETDVDDNAFSAIGDYLDVKLEKDTTITDLEIKVYYIDPDDIVGLVEEDLIMYW